MPQDYSFPKERVSYKDLDAHVGQKIKFRRSTLSMSQDKLGSCLGITFQQIQKYEKGVNRVSFSMLYNIAKILKVGMEYFVEGYNNAGKVLHDDNTLTYDIKSSKKKESKESSDLLRAYYKITNHVVRKKVLDIVKTFAKESS